MKEFRLNGKSYPCIITETGKTRIGGLPQSEFFGSLSFEEKKILAVAEARFRHPENTKSRQVILDDLYAESLIRTS